MEDIGRMGQLQTQIDTLTQELDRLKRQSFRIEGEIKSLQDKILEVGGDRLRAQKSKVDQIKEQTVLINDRITKSQVAKSKAEKDITKFENSLTKSQRELEELNEKIEQLEEEIQQKAEIARSIRARADEAKSVFVQNYFLILSVNKILILCICYLDSRRQKTRVRRHKRKT